MMQKKPPESFQHEPKEPASPTETRVEQVSFFFKRFQKEIFAVFGGIVLLLLLYFLLYHKSISYVQETVFDLQHKKSQLQLEEIKKEPAKIAETLQQLEMILKEDPSLTPMVQGEMTQAMLEIGQIKEALSHGDQLLRRTSREHLTLFQDFARGSFSIADNQLELALNNNYQELSSLKEANHTLSPEEEALWVWALIRAAFLEGMLGHREKSITLWKELLNIENGTAISHDKKLPSREVTQEVMQSLNMGAVAFTSFIKSQIEPAAS